MNPVENTLKAAASFSRNHRRDSRIQSAFGQAGLLSRPGQYLKRLKLEELVTRVQAMGPGRPLRILDLASSYGFLANSLAQLGHRVVGFDRRADHVKLAKSFTQEAKLNAIFIGADLARDPAWEKTAEEGLGGKPDLAILVETSSDGEIDELIGRLGKWLGLGAQLLIHQENPLSPVFQLSHRIRNKLTRSPDAEGRRTYQQWRMILEAAGFHTEGEPSGLDPIPMLAKFLPERAWSLVFTAKKEI